MSYLLSVFTHEILWFSLRVEICATCTKLYLVVFMALHHYILYDCESGAETAYLSRFACNSVKLPPPTLSPFSARISARCAVLQATQRFARFACNILNFCAYCTKTRSKYFESLCIFYAICGFLGLNHNMLWISIQNTAKNHNMLWFYPVCNLGRSLLYYRRRRKSNSTAHSACCPASLHHRSSVCTLSSKCRPVKASKWEALYAPLAPPRSHSPHSKSKSRVAYEGHIESKVLAYLENLI